MAELNDTEILTGMAEIIEEVTGVPAADVQPQRAFVDDLEIDSLSMVEILVAAEERFGVRIPDEAARDLRTVQDAVDFIKTTGVPA
ncbi:MAG: acyl carrier protein [Frankiales bacterium]|jgi:acyl carrier protein|nr:acyl carrier protein [Frankiales bacterium]